MWIRCLYAYPKGLTNRVIDVLARAQNIVPYLDHGEAEGYHYFVMDYVEGQNLHRTVWDRDGRLPLGEAIAITSDCLEALAYAHQRKIVHRDIKPSNVLVATGEGSPRARIADFGLAKNYEVAGSLSCTDVAKGTPSFMAPEQVAEAVVATVTAPPGVHLDLVQINPAKPPAE